MSFDHKDKNKLSLALSKNKWWYLQITQHATTSRYADPSSFQCVISHILNTSEFCQWLAEIASVFHHTTATLPINHEI